jgi:hypothetical protein
VITFGGWSALDPNDQHRRTDDRRPGAARSYLKLKVDTVSAQLP